MSQVLTRKIIGPVGLLLLATVAGATAAEPPSFDVERGCRSASARVGSAIVDPEVCIRSERRAESELKDQWSQFTDADRTVCIPLTRTGGMPTYSELVTCLETARDVRKLRAENNSGLGAGLKPRETTGSGASVRGSSGTVSPSGLPSSSPAGSLGGAGSTGASPGGGASGSGSGGGAGGSSGGGSN